MFDDDADIETAAVITMKPPAAKPCAQCPFSRASAPGWLGPWGIDEILFSLGRAPFPCHLTIDANKPEEFKACSGMAIFLNNKCERSRHPENAKAQDVAKGFPDDVKESVFSNGMEFQEHHKKGIFSYDD